MTDVTSSSERIRCPASPDLHSSTTEQNKTSFMNTTGKGEWLQTHAKDDMLALPIINGVLAAP